MKHFILSFFGFVISQSLVARAETRISWSELEIGMKTKLAQVVKVPHLSLAKGTRFTIQSSDTVSDLNLQIIEAQFEPCNRAIQNKKLPLEMADLDYGLELNPGCKVSFYLELKDFYRPSYFILSNSPSFR